MAEQLTAEQQAERVLYIERAPAVGIELVRPHVEAPGSNLVYLPQDHRNYPGQDPMEFRVIGTPSPKDDVTKVADQIVPGYRKMREAVSRDPQTRPIIDRSGKILDDDGDIWVITAHTDIKDFAFAEKMVLDLLDEQGYAPRKVIAIVGKALAEAGVELTLEGLDEPAIVPVIGTVGILCHTVYTPWQKTDTTRDVLKNLPKSEVDRNNQGVTDGVNQDLDEGGVVAGQGPTGSTTVFPDETGRRRMREINPGAADLLMHKKAHVLPVAMSLAGPEPKARLCGGPYKIENAVQLRRVMELMVAHTNELTPGQNLAYGSS